VDKSRSREKGGTGLGLAIVKHILEGHNTRAEVESLPGRGSTFRFKLPKGKPEKTDHVEHGEVLKD
jgi:two-component system phosphate regulon sensor histidine kinase PhoR